MVDDVTIKSLAPQGKRFLPAGEALLYDKVVNSGGTLRVNQSNGSKVLSMVNGFRKAMYAEHRNKYFVRNLPYVFAGVGLSLLAVIISLATSTADQASMGPAIVMMFMASIFTVIMVSIGFKFAGGSSFAGKFTSVIRWVVLGFLAFNFVPAGFGLLLQMDTGKIVLAGVAGIIMLNVLFWYLLGAPTPIGRKYMDGIEGLKTYINLAEKDRMNLAGAPVMSPQHFETVLPYAVSLGLEKPWSNAFQSWLATAAGAAAAASYSPNWYSGRNFSSGQLGDTMASLPSSISNSMTNAMPAPKSSSSGFGGGGGGGGSSGGGGGGGGGGGW